MRRGGGAGVAQGRRARGGAGGGFPSLQHLPLDRTRVRTVGHCGGDESHDQCRSPHLLYIWHCATGAHRPSIGLGVPDQDASQGPSCRWANWWRSILTFSPLISPYTFKTLKLDVTLFTFSLVALLLSSSHCRSVRRACLIMTVISYRQT